MAERLAAVDPAADEPARRGVQTHCSRPVALAVSNAERAGVQVHVAWFERERLAHSKPQRHMTTSNARLRIPVGARFEHALISAWSSAEVGTSTGRRVESAARATERRDSHAYVHKRDYM